MTEADIEVILQRAREKFRWREFDISFNAVPLHLPRYFYLQSATYTYTLAYRQFNGRWLIMKPKHLLWVYGLFFLFFLQLLSDFIESIYVFGLLSTGVTLEIVSIVLLFSPSSCWRSAKDSQGLY